MAVDHFAITAHQTRNPKAKFKNTAAHAIHRGIVLARVARIENQFVDRPSLDFR
jgi:hypothetical protein